MATLRFKALGEISRREPIEPELSDKKISDYFGADVFDREKMRQYISKEAYESLCDAIDEGRRIDRKIANQVAQGMKTWAMEKGATHYSHWFQPLNDSTAEKHDAFFEPMWGGGSFETFKGELLVQQEPDASSFPNGGLRNTFEARGYSAWDPSSPAFILDKTLCIPSIFIAYTGEALDFKTPLLKSLTAVDKAAVEVCQYFDKDVDKVNVTLGWEQEYFLVDEALFLARPDLMQTGRTLMGHIAAKDQQLDDHYFGAIPDRVLEFMKDFEQQAYRLGIPLKTRHNEVAPNQFECAPMFEEANIAVDHNTLLMTIMRRVALRHKLRVLFHEKPFLGVNGSGKHCNWSLCTNTGVNLLAPGKTPKNNIQFLAFFVNTIMAAHKFGVLFMASIATQSNSHRLGAHEAPPAVMSVFTGSTLSAVLDSLEQRVSEKKMTPDEKTEIKLDIGKIPNILLDNTDRNRTSPFAFTGNKFEFRMLGSAASISDANVVLNTAVAESLRQYADVLEQAEDFETALHDLIRNTIQAHKRIIFNGNGYDASWLEEAEKRGLLNLKTTPDCVPYLLKEKNVRLFTTHKIYSETELHARYEIMLENYSKVLRIEALTMLEMVNTDILPAVSDYTAKLVRTAEDKKALLGSAAGGYEQKTAARLSSLTEIASEDAAKLDDALLQAGDLPTAQEAASFYQAEVFKDMTELRLAVDEMETLTSRACWPYPSYGDLLFSVR